MVCFIFNIYDIYDMDRTYINFELTNDIRERFKLKERFYLERENNNNGRKLLQTMWYNA